ncbi:MAG: hypothetical protein ABI454_04840 [Sphingomicrobium sp.]
MDELDGLRDFIRSHSPAAKQQRQLEALRVAAKAPNHPKASELLDMALRQMNPKTLGLAWTEWKNAGATDLRLRIEQEQERRKRRSSTI